MIPGVRRIRTLRHHGLGHGPGGVCLYTGPHPWGWQRLVCFVRGHREMWVRRGGGRHLIEFARCATCKGNYGEARVVR